MSRVRIIRGTRFLALTAFLVAFALTAFPAAANAATTVQEANPLLVWSGAWSPAADPSAAGGVRRVSTTAGAAVTVAFNGTSFVWIGGQGPMAGAAAVSLDGVSKGVIDLAAGPEASLAQVWVVAGLKNGYHYVTIRALESVDAAGSGSINVDAFATDGAVTAVRQKTPFKYPWKTYIVIDKSEYKLYWVKNGYLIKTYKIAHGRKKGWTPNRIWRIDQKYKTNPRGVYGPRKMRLYKQVKTRSGIRYVYTAYGIHGTNQPWVIGTMASHGCIRLNNKDILELWPQVPLHTMVVTRD